MERFNKRNNTLPIEAAYGESLHHHPPHTEENRNRQSPHLAKENELTAQSTKTAAGVASVWKKLMVEAVTSSITGLSQMCNQHIKVASLKAKMIPIGQTADLLGGADAFVAGVNLKMFGPGDGLMVVVLTLRTAFDLIDVVMDEPNGTTQDFGELELSVLGEIGNVMGAHFLNTISDEVNLELQVSPPKVTIATVGKIVDEAQSILNVKSEDMLVLDTAFGTPVREIHG
ncbi:MAG: chemotaxis protein CheC, partial [SAR202 cluster bacterium]|nr:chemotaxis protein CheC [SAR202 cluster bacterium]